MDRPDTVFEILGPLQVESGGRVVEASRVAVRSLLGVLLLTPGQRVATQRLAELVWGPGGCSRGTVQTTVHRLRSWLREGAGLEQTVSYTGDGYLIDVAADRVDATRFGAAVRSAMHGTAESQLDALRQALDLWRGPVLGNISAWLDDHPVVLGLTRARADAARRLATLAIEAGRPEAALLPLQRIATDLPYDEAVHAQLVSVMGASGRRADGLRHYEVVRRRLAEELGVDPSPPLHDAHLVLLRQEHRRPACAAPAGTSEGRPGQAARGPCLLPADVADFTGQAEQLQAIRRTFECGRHTAVALTAVVGPGGVGKTTLAVHAAHQLGDVFTDGRLYVNLGVHPAEPGQVLARFMRAFGVVAAEIPDSLEERAEMFRARLAGRRVLVVLDGVTDEAQVSALIPGSPTCGVILTSRTRLSGLAGVHQVGLDALATDHAVDLLARIAGRGRVAAEPHAAAELVRLCDRLPLAVRIAGAKLAARRHWSVGRLVHRLSNETRRLDELAHGQLDVRASIDRSYRSLDERAARLFRRLGLLEAADPSPWLAAPLLDASAAEAEEVIECLVDAHLLDVGGRDAGGQVHYRFPDLIRLYARERAFAEESEQSRSAVLDRARGSSGPAPIHRLHPGGAHGGAITAAVSGR